MIDIGFDTMEQTTARRYQQRPSHTNGRIPTGYVHYPPNLRPLHAPAQHQGTLGGHAQRRVRIVSVDNNWQIQPATEYSSRDSPEFYSDDLDIDEPRGRSRPRDGVSRTGRMHRSQSIPDFLHSSPTEEFHCRRSIPLEIPNGVASRAKQIGRAHV